MTVEIPPLLMRCEPCGVDWIRNNGMSYCWLNIITYANDSTVWLLIVLIGIINSDTDTSPVT